VLAGADVVDQDAGSYVPSLGRRNHALLGVHYQSENEGQKQVDEDELEEHPEQEQEEEGTLSILF